MRKKSSQIDTIEKQWKHIADRKWSYKTSTVDFWVEVHNFQNSVGENTFKELSEFVLSQLLLSVCLV